MSRARTTPAKWRRQADLGGDRTADYRPNRPLRADRRLPDRRACRARPVGRPVRVGDAAAAQPQLDVSGGVLDAALLCAERMRTPRAELLPVLSYLADRAAARWREYDHGIWEVRGRLRHPPLAADAAPAMIRTPICWSRGHRWKYDRRVWGSGLDAHDRYLCETCRRDRLEPIQGPERAAAPA